MAAVNGKEKSFMHYHLIKENKSLAKKNHQKKKGSSICAYIITVYRLMHKEPLQYRSVLERPIAIQHKKLTP
jgi:hypothetical protein